MIHRAILGENATGLRTLRMARVGAVLLVLAGWASMANGQEETLLQLDTLGAVENGPTQPTTFTLDAPTCITKIRTYHWNGGRGSAVGTISLQDQAGTVLGPWDVSGEPGSGGAPNAYWDAKPDLELPAGTYTVLDSDPATWSQNRDTGGRGITWVYGRKPAAEAPAGPEDDRKELRERTNAAIARIEVLIRDVTAEIEILEAGSALRKEKEEELRALPVYEEKLNTLMEEIELLEAGSSLGREKKEELVKLLEPFTPHNGPDTGGTPVDGAVTSTIGPAGGAVALADGTLVEIPAGAVDKNVSVTVHAVDPGEHFPQRDDRVRYVIECTAPVSRFSTPVKIRFPLPADATTEAAEGMHAGYIDTERGMKADLPCTFAERDGRKELVLETTHFTRFYLDRLKNLFSSPPASRTVENVPYYNQGISTYCWAACTQMICEAVTESDTPGEIWDIIGRMKVPPTGLTSVTAAFSATWSDVMRERAGVSPDLQYWQASMVRLRAYIYEQIGFYGNPVLYSSSSFEHAVVIVGYDTTPAEPIFIVNDPRAVGTEKVAYRRVTAAELHLGNEDSLDNPVVTAVLHKDVSSRPAVRVSLATQCFEAKIVASRRAEYFWTWDHTRTRGYSFRMNPLAEGADVIPGTIRTAEGSTFIQVSNATSTEQALSCDYSIRWQKNPVAQKHNYVVVPPYGLALVPVDQADFEALRTQGPLGPDYVFHVQLLKGGDFIDSAMFDFSESSGKIVVHVLETQKEWAKRIFDLKKSNPGQAPDPGPVVAPDPNATPSDQNQNQQSDPMPIPDEPVTWSYPVGGKDVQGSGRTDTSGHLEIPVPLGVQVTIQARGETDSTTCDDLHPTRQVGFGMAAGVGR